MKVTINQKAQERLQTGHDWIFRSDIVEVEKEQAGTATVYSEKGKVLGEALYSPKSLIALRFMTRGADKITGGLIQERLRESDRRRRALFPGETAYRVAFGEADRLPSLIVDRFDEVLVFQTLSAGMDSFKETVIETLREIFQPRAIIERNDSTVRQREELPLLRQSVFGEAPAEVNFRFRDKTFSFDPVDGQKTGFFLDQRFNALEASHYVLGEMLDAFSYVGQFGVHAAGKAESVLCVDASQPALSMAAKNAEQNGLNNLHTHCENVFDFLKQCDQASRRFDTISLDPPAFVKNRAALKPALRGYKEINLRAMRLLNPGGILISSSCSQHLSGGLFEKVLTEAGRDSKRRVQILEKRGQPADHPILLGIPETEYLKCYILRVE